MSPERRRVVTPPPFEDTQSAHFRYVFASGTFTGLSPNNGGIVFYLDRLVPGTTAQPLGGIEVKKIARERQVEVYLSPTQYKQLCITMQRAIANYEQTFGEIPLKPKGGQPTQTPSGLVT
jgi:hypothetical protein